jgi:hypothetical protein
MLFENCQLPRQMNSYEMTVHGKQTAQSSKRRRELSRASPLSPCRRSEYGDEQPETILQMLYGAM